MKHFTYDEFEHSSTATSRHIDNTIPPVCRLNIAKLVEHILDPAREQMGMPITVTSGYRCERLNRVIAGAAKNSLHLQGKAADIRCGDNERLLEILKQMPCYELIVYRYKQSGRINRFHVSYNGGRKGSWFSKYI